MLGTIFAELPTAHHPAVLVLLSAGGFFGTTGGSDFCWSDMLMEGDFLGTAGGDFFVPMELADGVMTELDESGISVSSVAEGRMLVEVLD